MESKLHHLYERYHRLIGSIPFVEKDLDYSVLERHKPHLDKIDALERSAVAVFDLFRKTHVYASPSYRNKLGLSDGTGEVQEGFELLMHPDDHLRALEAGIYFLGMVIRLESNEMRKYKAVYDFRIRKPGLKSDGRSGEATNWLRITEQHQVLENDIHGNIWLVLSIASVSSNQDSGSSLRGMVVHHETGELFVVPDDEKTPFLNLTAREIEVLKLISEGFYSKEISDRLKISIHTVNTHRQNIIEKLKASNTTEAVQMAMKYGYFK